MLKYPASVPEQRPILSALQAVVQQYPACEAWITFTQQVPDVLPTLSSGSLHVLSQMAQQMAKVFDWIDTQAGGSVLVDQYLLRLSRSAREIAGAAALASIGATGNGQMALTINAQAAYSTLQAWDPALGYQQPTTPGALAYQLVQGVSFA